MSQIPQQAPATTTSAAKSYQHIQDTASTTWSINHNLNNYPIIDVMVDVNGLLTKIIPHEVLVIDMNNCQITFSIPYSGQARMV
jgi:hypothetical protein